MAANPRMVNADISINWDGTNSVSNGFGGYTGYHLARGTIIDVPAGGTLETAIGNSNLTALTSQQTADMGGAAIGPEDTGDMGGGTG